MKLFDDQNRFMPENLVDAQAALKGKSTSNDRDAWGHTLFHFLTIQRLRPRR